MPFFPVGGGLFPTLPVTYSHTASVIGSVNAFQLHLAGRCKFLKDLIDVVGVCNASQTGTYLCAVVVVVVGVELVEVVVVMVVVVVIVMVIVEVVVTSGSCRVY